jgi:uncharacterized protein (TIGR03382 family)
MRTTISAIALLSVAGSAFATGVIGTEGSASQEAFITSTVRPDGPRQFEGNLSQLFFNAQGAANGQFASFGALRYDGQAIINDLDAQFGVGHWAITDISISLFQSNASFTTNGGVEFLWVSDDSVDIVTPAGAQFPYSTGQFGSEGFLAGYDFVEVADGFEDIVDFGGSGVSDLINDILAGDIVSILVNPTDDNVSATWAGNAGNFDGPGPTLTVNAVKIPAPGAAALFGLAGLAAARRRR